VNTQQIVLLMGLSDVQFPANAHTFFKQIRTIASFDYLDLNPYINGILLLNDTEPYSVMFDEMGYDSMYYSNNLGTLNLAFLFYVAALGVMFYYKDRKLKSKRARNRYYWLKELLLYDFILSTVKESYASMAVCSFISI
jgi:predicted aminopeptidase